MRRFGTPDTKNRLSEPLVAVEAGESIEIVRRGKPVARLVPIPRENRFASADEAAEWLQQNRAVLSAGTLRELGDDGRR